MLIILAAVLTAAILTSMIITGPVRMYRAGRAADRFAANAGLEFNYEADCEFEEAKDLYREIWELAIWSCDMTDRIDAAFGLTRVDYKQKETESVPWFENEEKVQKYALRRKWRRLRDDVGEHVKKQIDRMFQDPEKPRNTRPLFGVESATVYSAYVADKFRDLVAMMQYLEEGDGKTAYNSCLPYKLEYDSDYLLMDIAYAFYPEELTAGGEESLLEAAFKSDSKSLYNAEMKGEAFAQRYHINLKNLKKVYARGQWLYNKEHPSSKSSGSSGKKKSKSRKSYSYGSHSSSNSSSRPEDRDIESYYEDNRDEYDDYDEAYDDFLDDEGAWDDY